MSNKYNLEFEPIPSLKYRYEINSYGVVRNSKTKKVLTPRPTSSVNKCCDVGYCLSPDKYVRVSRTRQQLLWEVFGVSPERPQKLPIPVTIRKNGDCRYFKSCYDCAKWLSPKIFLSVGSIRAYLKLRRTVIYGWQISYHLPEKRKIRTPAEIIGDRYLKRTDKEMGKRQRQ